ncbi:tetratricopeptide repeat protein [Campylobacter concisus]|uniref:tetratricopeptide repeat protein n=1 Tax=Campylobacter concisus TaxID=199 RepID=UPI0011E61BA8|nr:tetratricopeptide repeat protein [Campylobacter concisus]
MKKIFSVMLFASCFCFANEYDIVQAALKNKDYEKAEKILNKECGQNRAWACNQLAFLYAKGDLKILSLFESAKKAKELYQKACDGGNANGCAGLGEMFFREQNYAKAFELYQKACDDEDGYGCGRLASLYYKGLGIEKDKSKAKELNKKACDLGNQFSCKFAK